MSVPVTLFYMQSVHIEWFIYQSIVHDTETETQRERKRERVEKESSVEYRVVFLLYSIVMVNARGSQGAARTDRARCAVFVLFTRYL